MNRPSHVARQLCRMGTLICLLAWPLAASAAPAKHKELPLALPRAEPPLRGLRSLAEANRLAAADRKPILVRVQAAHCLWCRKLQAEMEKPAVREELQRWILVDLDQSADDAESLNVDAVPALRIFTVRGRLAAARDGYLSADDLVDWLKKSYEVASPALDAVLADSDKPNLLAVVRLVRLLAQRDPLYREAAIRRLASCPDVAAPAVVKTLREGRLGARLAALEILTQWRAPIDGLDPWRPETLTEAKLAAIERWVEAGVKPPPRAEWTAAERAAARLGIEQMLRAAESDVEALRERLARLGPQLLPEIQQRLGRAATDAERQRLTALRYRLVARDALVLHWPGGLDRLSSADARQRRKAAEELAAMADAQDQPLLMELFVDADPLIREMGLRGLRNMGGSQAVAALVKLLDDPLPNVRAAVLKQLAEDPFPEMVPAVGNYLKHEKDADLAVHAVRFFQAAGGREAVKNLLVLLHHPSWQVRAEAAEAVGQAVTSYQRRVSDELRADAYAALIELLADGDAFVVSRAVAALGTADMEIVVEPLAQAAVRHPELTEAVVEIFSHSDKMYAKSMPHLRRLCKHPDPQVRAAALRGIGKGTVDELQAELLSGLGDPTRVVRIAAAAALFESLDSHEKNAQVRLGRGAMFSDNLIPAPELGVFGWIVRAVTASVTPKPMPPPAAKPAAGTPLAPGKGQDKVGNQKEPLSPGGRGQGEGGNRKNPVSSPGPPLAAKPSPDQRASNAPQPAPLEEPAWDQWLRKYYARKRPAAIDRMLPPLEKMLHAADAEESLAAAVALVPLGRCDIALPVVRQRVKAEPKHLDRAAPLLPWLLWPDRVQLFEQLWPLAGEGHESGQLIVQMSETGDERAVDRFWTLLADPKLTPQSAGSLKTGLQQLYRLEQGGGSQARRRRELLAAARPRAASGPELQRLVALALIAQVDAAEAAEIARRLAADEKQSPALRNDAFQVLLAAEPKAQAAPEAVAALSAADAARRKIALDYLVANGERYFELREAINVNISSVDQLGGDDQGLPAAPRGLKTAHLVPLLRHADPKVAAYAGYLLALLGDPQGLDKLIAYWREQGRSQDSLTQLVYRAIAALDDARQLPLLEKIYQQLSEYEVRDFYWTIRAMSGTEIVKFRQRIRSQVGAEKLR